MFLKLSKTNTLELSIETLSNREIIAAVTFNCNYLDKYISKSPVNQFNKKYWCVLSNYISLEIFMNLHYWQTKCEYLYCAFFPSFFVSTVSSGRIAFNRCLLSPLSLSRRIEYCQTADDFYSTMGCLTQEMLEHNLIDPAELMQVRSVYKQNHF